MIYERQDSQIPITVPFKQLVKVFPAQPCGKDEMSEKKKKNTGSHLPVPGGRESEKKTPSSLQPCQIQSETP